MITSDHLTAIKDLLEMETRLAVYLADATGGAFPRIVVTPAYGTPGERPLSDDLDLVEMDIRVASAGATLKVALDAAERARRALSPGLGLRRIPMPGWVASTKFRRHEMTEVDRDVQLTGTNTHPVYTVEAFHVSSERTS
ncbi:MAG: hypothetical protein ACTHXF_08970 [Brevibacterium yomogidense]